MPIEPGTGEIYATSRLTLNTQTALSAGIGTPMPFSCVFLKLRYVSTFLLPVTPKLRSVYGLGPKL